MEASREESVLRGIVTPTVTPFDTQGNVDFDSLGRLIEFLLTKGVHGICPCGTTGEYFALTIDERRSILKFVAETVGSRAKLFAGTNASTTSEVIALTSTARELGYSGVLLGAPPIARPSRQELVVHFRRVLEEAGLSIILYNNPPRTGVDLDPAFLRELLGVANQPDAGSSGIIGLKEACGSLSRLHTLALDFGDHLEVACGADSQALEFFLWGSRSWIAGPSNFLPGECVSLYESCVINGDFDAGRTLMRRMLPVLKTLDDEGKFLQYCKYGCELAGVPIGTTRPPLGALTEEEKSRLRGTLDALSH